MTHSAALNYKAIVRILGTILFIIGISMIIPWLYAEFAKEPESARAFRICAPITAVFGLLIMVTIKNHTVKFRSREGYLVVALCWLIASIAGAFPYYISGHAGNFLDAIFESTAGFTTTGCTSINAEYTEQSLVLWKAISHWLGGMGILVFVISILPALGINGQYIARAESPGPVLEKMTVRMSDSAKILYLTYFTFTALEFILLMLSGKMPVFDAAVNTMGSISTGGLVVHPAGIIHYDSLYVEIVISVFCILSSVNFVLYHYLITGKPGYLFKDIELRVYLCIIAIAVCICTVSLVFVDGLAPGSALRESFFQVVSMATTTGYVRDTNILWSATCQIIMIALLFIGGCSASTAGSIKVVRIIVMMKLIWRGCIKRIHPRSVVAVKLGDSSMSVSLVTGITTFIFTYLGVFFISAVILSLQGLDMETTFTTTLAMLSNTGIAFGETSSIINFSFFHPLLKLYLSALMIIGRLELFTILILFTRNFWGRAR